MPQQRKQGPGGEGRDGSQSGMDGREGLGCSRNSSSFVAEWKGGDVSEDAGRVVIWGRKNFFKKRNSQSRYIWKMSLRVTRGPTSWCIISTLAPGSVA